MEAAIFADGGRALIASDDSGSVSLVDVATGRRLGAPLSAGDEPVASLSLSPDGRLLAAGSFGGSVFVWDTKTGRPYGSPLTADTGRSATSRSARRPDARDLAPALGGRMEHGWWPGDRRALGGPGDSTTGVAFSPDGRWLLAGRLDGGAIVYDAATHRPVRRVEVISRLGVAFHPDEPSPSPRSTARSRLFDRRTGSPAGRPLDVPDTAVAVAFSPDAGCWRRPSTRTARALRSTGRSETAGEVWDVASRRPMGRAIVPGRGSVLSIAFDPEGRSSRPPATRASSTSGTRPRTPTEASRCAWPRTASRASRSIRAAGSSRPGRHRPGARLARRRSTCRLSAARRA